MKYTPNPCGDYYSKEDIANLFNRPISFVNKLKSFGMPCVMICRNFIVPKDAFWKWAGSKGIQDGEQIITIREMAKELGISNASAYRIKNELPNNAVIHVGKQSFILKKALLQYITEQSITNIGG